MVKGFRVSKDLLLKLLNFVNFKGINEIKNIYFKSGKEKLLLNFKAPSKILASVSSIDIAGEAFEFGLRDLALFKKALNSFRASNIMLTKDKNKLVMASDEDTHKVSLILRDKTTLEDLILEKSEEEKVESLLKDVNDNTFTLSKDNLTFLLSFINGFDEEVSLEGDSKGIRVKAIKDENEVEALIQYAKSSITRPFKVTLPSLFLELLNNIKDEITMGVDTIKPISVQGKYEGLEVKFLVAPIVREE